MYEEKKAFEEPVCEIIKLMIEDVITTSIPDEEDWGIGEF